MNVTAYQINLALDAEKFGNWLQEMNTEAFSIVGTTCDATSCPIATYLKSIFEVNGRFFVDGEEVMIYEPDGMELLLKTDMPEWGRQFVEQVDLIPDIFPQYETYTEVYEDDETGKEFTETESYKLENIQVTAGDCINILNRVMEKIEEEEPES